MHGSDAHEQRRVGVPDEVRYSWIKGALEFDTLRQACIDPAGRAFVGAEPPVSATPSQIIKTVEIKEAPWAKTPALMLNPGLVAIIGARGSGKTALADMIALGCDATSERLSPASFLIRAEELLQGGSVSLGWQAGESSERSLDRSDEGSAAQYPRARYLSQKFVEELCSAHGMTDALMREIERVILEAHPLSDRDGAVCFEELLEMRAMRYREARYRGEEALSELSERIGTELEKDKLVAGLRKQISEKETLITAYTNDRSKLVSKGSEAKVERLGAVTSAAEKVRGYLRYFGARERSLLALQDEVSNFRNYQAPEALRRSQEKHRSSGLESEDWASFLLDYSGDVDGSLTRHLASARRDAKHWRGSPPAPAAEPQVALIADDAPLESQPLALLEAEIARLEKAVSVDRDLAHRFAALSKRIVEESAALDSLKEKLADCDRAKERARTLVKEREAAYVEVFSAVLAEQTVLTDLYSPLMARLKAAEGTLKKLSFSVTREADVARWAAEGERLLDLRHKGPFKGRGTLGQLAEAALKAAWETGDPQTVSAAMAKFRSDNQEELLEHSPVPKGNDADYRTWLKAFAK